jgi:hypothetical protein
VSRALLADSSGEEIKPVKHVPFRLLCSQ